MRHLSPGARALCAALVLSGSVAAQRAFPLQRDFVFQQGEDGSIVAADERGTYWFPSFQEYARSSFFRAHGLRCGADRLNLPAGLGTIADCSDSNTNPAPEYDPENGILYDIPVVVHVITRLDGYGDVPRSLIESQIDVLNEDFQALAGSNGALGTNARISFHLAGVTRSANNLWYDDEGLYFNMLAWDPLHYVNIYTNSASGYLGYAYPPNGGGVVGNLWDRVVIYWEVFGRFAPYGPPYDLGRTATHEVGHYLGLDHTFQGGCAPTLNCYKNGDLICDTLPEAEPNLSPCIRLLGTCDDPDPTDNYMDYSDDLCMTMFTPEQSNRMRCTLANFRIGLGREAKTGLADRAPAAAVPAVR